MNLIAKCAAMAAVLVSAAGMAHAGVIYSDNFTGTAGTALGGSAPTTASGTDGGSATATWNAATTAAAATTTTATGFWQYNGSGSASITGTDVNATTGVANGLIAGAYLPFVPQAGQVYTLTITLAPTIGDGTSGNWLGIGFFQAALNGHAVSGTNAALSNNNPYGLLIDKPTGVYQSFAGLGTANAGPTATIAKTPHTFAIQLDTTGTNYTFAWSVDGGAFSTPQTASATPNIGLVGFGTNKQAGSVSSFSLSTNVPEPTSVAALAGGAALLVSRRRR